MATVKSLRELAPAPGTLVLLDVDQTLIRAPGYFGSEPWYYHRVDEHAARGLGPREAIRAADAEWVAAARQIVPVLVEPDSPDVIRGWHARGVRTMGLTARNVAVASLTAQYLEKLGVRMNPPVVKGQPPPDPDVTWRSGIYFVGPLHPKADRFAELYPHLDPTPEHVLFVDDRAEHVERMTKWLAAAGIPGAALRFTGAEAWAASFD